MSLWLIRKVKNSSIQLSSSILNNFIFPRDSSGSRLGLDFKEGNDVGGL